MDAGGHMQLGKSKQPKHKPKTQGKTQIPQPDLRLTIRKTAKQTANGARAQPEKPQKICQETVEKIHCVAINSKTCNKRISSHPETWDKRTILLPRGQQKSHLLYTVD